MHHAPLAAMHFPFRGYVRNHVLPGQRAKFETISEFWADDLARLTALWQGPAGAILAQDEARFMDRERITPAEAVSHSLSSGAPTDRQGRRWVLLLRWPGSLAPAALLPWAARERHLPRRGRHAADPRGGTGSGLGRFTKNLPSGAQNRQGFGAGGDCRGSGLSRLGGGLQHHRHHAFSGWRAGRRVTPKTSATRGNRKRESASYQWARARSGWRAYVSLNISRSESIREERSCQR